jgi:hypothetical protein
MSFLNIWGSSRGLNTTVNADAISPHFGPYFEVRELRARVATPLEGKKEIHYNNRVERGDPLDMTVAELPLVW